jgi:hypothetical protein
MLMLPLFMVPLIGLAIDATMLYIVQAKLSAAVDGAALGAGRLLGTNANTTEIAGEFLKVNFPNGYWGSKNLTPTITATNNLGAHKIVVTATADVPLLFMRVTGARTSLVAATATATRQDTRVVLVLDRSGSMNTTDPVSHLNVFSTMKTSAANFTGMFTPGTDELGLVVFAGSGIVAYPTANPPYNTDTHSAGGPDTSFASSSTAGPMFTQINTMVSGGGTNIGEAMTLAYIELQKAHYRDLAATGVDNRLNAIVLFTDGVPDAIAVNPNDSVNNALKTSSPCTYNPETTDASTQMRGYIVTPGNPPSWGTSQGLYLLSSQDSGHTLTWWLQHSSSDQTTSSPSTAIGNCTALGRGGTFTLSDLRQIPPFDVYGTSTDGVGYSHSSLAYNGTNYDKNQPTVGYHLALGAWNATDNMGKIIRTQTAMLPVTIFTIGYNGNGGTDAGLLKRLANTLDSSSFAGSPEQSGQYYQVNSADQLSGAFAAVASSLLRLAK